MPQQAARASWSPSRPVRILFVVLVFPALIAVLILFGFLYWVWAGSAADLRDVTAGAACQVTGCGRSTLALCGVLLFASPYLGLALLIRFWGRLHVVFRVLAGVGVLGLAAVALPWAGFMGVGSWSQIMTGGTARPFGTGAFCGALWTIVVLVVWWPIIGIFSLRSAPMSADFTGKFLRAGRGKLVLSHGIPLVLAAALAVTIANARG